MNVQNGGGGKSGRTRSVNETEPLRSRLRTVQSTGSQQLLRVCSSYIVWYNIVFISKQIVMSAIIRKDQKQIFPIFIAADKMWWTRKNIWVTSSEGAYARTTMCSVSGANFRHKPTC